MKKLFFIFFAVFLCLQLLHYAPVLKLLQYAIRHKIEKWIAHGVPKEHLYKITVSRGEVLRWEKPDKDFWYKGSLYDVIGTTANADSVTYYCVQDVAETQLLQLFKANAHTTAPLATHSILSWDFAKKVVVWDSSSANLVLPVRYLLRLPLTTLLTGYSCTYSFLFIVRIDFPPEV